MFITFLKFSDNRAAAPRYMAAHNEWIAKGFSDGVFLCVGSLEPGAGGAILAHGEDRDSYEARIMSDPFVLEGIVIAETSEIDPKKAMPELGFLVAA
ncbi:MAG: hypothetical protein JJ891_03645 [Rhizobiaceae bacterium]|nr:hypothetical protein [Rhizobiaceae bacterium]